MRVRIKEGQVHGAYRQYREGDELEVTPQELAEFGDKFVVVKDSPLDAIKDSSVTDRVVFAQRVQFDASDLTIKEVLAAVEDGSVLAQIALESELSGRQRVTLISKLKDLEVDDGNS